MLAAAAVFAAVNALLRPIVVVLALPLVILSLGVALFFVSMLMLWLTAEIVADFEVGGFWSLAAGTLVVWGISVLLNALLRPQRRSAGARA